MKRYGAILCLLIFGLAFAFGAPAKKITVLGVWGGQEADVFNEICKTFTAKTGIDVDFEATRDLDAVITTRVEAGNPPDICGLPGPGKMIELANKGKLVDLSTMLDMEAFDKNYASGWKDLGSVDGKLYGIYTKAAVKGPVWTTPRPDASGFVESLRAAGHGTIVALSAKDPGRRERLFGR